MICLLSHFDFINNSFISFHSSLSVMHINESWLKSMRSPCKCCMNSKEMEMEVMWKGEGNQIISCAAANIHQTSLLCHAFMFWFSMPAAGNAQMERTKEHGFPWCCIVAFGRFALLSDYYQVFHVELLHILTSAKVHLKLKKSRQKNELIARNVNNIRKEERDGKEMQFNAMHWRRVIAVWCLINMSSTVSFECCVRK